MHRTRGLRKGLLTLAVGAVGPALVALAGDGSDPLREDLAVLGVALALLAAPYGLLAALAPRVSTLAWAVALAALAATSAVVLYGALVVDPSLGLAVPPACVVQLAMAGVTWLTQGSADRRAADARRRPPRGAPRPPAA